MALHVNCWLWSAFLMPHQTNVCSKTAVLIFAVQEEFQAIARFNTARHSSLSSYAVLLQACSCTAHMHIEHAKMLLAMCSFGNARSSCG
jgi:hypothetical protein